MDRSCQVAIQTPMGPLVVAVGAEGGEVVPPASSERTPSGGWVDRWAESSGVGVECLVTPYDPVLLEPYAVTASWGAVLVVSASRPSAPLRITAGLPDGLVGSGDDGECLAAAEFVHDGWRLHLGGPDEDLLDRMIDDRRLPASWAGRFTGDPGVFADSPSGLTWRFPSLPARTSFRTHVAVAWAPLDGVPESTWFAVDNTSAAWLTDEAQRPR